MLAVSNRTYSWYVLRTLPGRLMAGQRPLEPSVKVRVLPGQHPSDHSYGTCQGIPARWITLVRSLLGQK